MVELENKHVKSIYWTFNSKQMSKFGVNDAISNNNNDLTTQLLNHSTRIDIPPFVQFILEKLKAAGHKGYVAGGAVRDACRGKVAKDWDVTTSASPELIRVLFQEHRQFSLKHDTVSLVSNGQPFEITTFRGNRKGIEGDLRLRDFTMNAMALDVEKGVIIDPCGGREDLVKRIIRAAGSPWDRFREDPLRLLRAVRFAAETGFGIERNTLTAMGDLATLLQEAAQERIRDELIRILAVRKPSSSFHLMVRTGLLREFLPELLEGRLKRQNRHHRYTILKHTLATVDNVRPDAGLRMAALLHDIAKPRVARKIDGEWRFFEHEKESALLAEEIMERLKFSRAMISKVCCLIRRHLILYDTGWSDGAVRRLIGKVGEPLIEDLFALREADLCTHTARAKQMEMLKDLKDRVQQQLESKAALQRKDLAIDGRTIMAERDLPPGPLVGKILRELHEKILDQPSLNNRDSLISILRRMPMPTHLSENTTLCG